MRFSCATGGLLYFRWVNDHQDHLCRNSTETATQIILEAASIGMWSPRCVRQVPNTPLGTAYLGTAISARPGFDWHDSVVSGLIISAWVLDITLNVSVTMAIAGRLWWMGRTTASITPTRTNRYALSVYATVESGAIFAGANIISLVLFISNSFGFSTALDVSSQVAVRVHHHYFSFVH